MQCCLWVRIFGGHIWHPSSLPGDRLKILSAITKCEMDSVYKKKKNKTSFWTVTDKSDNIEIISVIDRLKVIKLKMPIQQHFSHRQVKIDVKLLSNRSLYK